MSRFVLLDLCLRLMEKTGENFSTGITLFVNGAMISGDLIHPVAYLKGMSELLEVQPDKNAITIGMAMSEAIEARTKKAHPNQGRR